MQMALIISQNEWHFLQYMVSQLSGELKGKNAPCTILYNFTCKWRDHRVCSASLTCLERKLLFPLGIARDGYWTPNKVTFATLFFANVLILLDPFRYFGTKCDSSSHGKTPWAAISISLYLFFKLFVTFLWAINLSIICLICCLLL